MPIKENIEFIITGNEEDEEIAVDKIGQVIRLQQGSDIICIGENQIEELIQVLNKFKPK